MDFNLHDKQESRKQNARLRHADPENEMRLRRFPVTAIMQNKVKGAIPKRATHRKQEQQAQPNKNYSNDFVVHK